MPDRANSTGLRHLGYKPVGLRPGWGARRLVDGPFDRRPAWLAWTVLFTESPEFTSSTLSTGSFVDQKVRTEDVAFIDRDSVIGR